MFNNVTQALNYWGGRLITKEEIDMFKGLNEYESEKPTEGGSFEAFKYKGPVDVLEARVYKVGSENATTFYPEGMELATIKLLVTDGENKGRFLNKKFDLNNEKKVKKLINNLNNIGNKIDKSTPEEEIVGIISRLSGTKQFVNAWFFSMTDKTTGDKKDIQDWFLMLSEEANEEAAAKSVDW